MGCQDRHEACHGHCEAYKEYAEEVRKKRIFGGCYVVSTSRAHKHRKEVL